MNRHHHSAQPTHVEALDQAQQIRPGRRRSLLVAGLVLALTTLACTVFGPTARPDADGVVMLRRLPTFTPTPLPLDSAAPPVEALPAEPVLAAATPAAPVDNSTVAQAAFISNEPAPPVDTAVVDLPALPAEASPENVTASPEQPAVEAPPASSPPPAPVPAGSPDWQFVNVQLWPDPANNRLLLYGNLVNNSSAPLEVQAINGTFYNGQGQPIATTTSDDAYWAGYTAPPGGPVPFGLIVDDIDSAADYSLTIEAEPTGTTPRQDFEFLETQQSNEAGLYCVSGQLRNPGGGLQEYLIIAAVLYGAQDRVIDFGDYAEFGPTAVMGDQTSAFEICLDSPAQTVARYELQAWGL